MTAAAASFIKPEPRRSFGLAKSYLAVNLVTAVSVSSRMDGWRREGELVESSPVDTNDDECVWQ